MIGQPIALLLPADRIDEEAMILERLRRGERLRHYETVRVRKDGSELAVALTISPILEPLVRSSVPQRSCATSLRSDTASRASRNCKPELAHVARLSTMVQMASAIAHELNQPLTAVRNYAGALGRMLAARMPIRTVCAKSSSGSASRPPRRRSDQAAARPCRQAPHHAPA